jgi:endonuclease YncB( thermonuclease family)
MATRLGAARSILGTILVLLLVGISQALAGCDVAPKQESGRHHAGKHLRHHHPIHVRSHPQARPARTHLSRPAPRTHPAARTFLVSRIVDGDTLELGNGETVRLVGIDTPEVGQCGYQAASDRLGALVLGKQVRLTVSDEDRDRYGRLLRYVDVGSMDAGLRLIRSGLAIARYDSRDGYGYHPRQPTYVRADRASRPVGCARPAPLAQPVQAAGNCAPGYQPCVPPFPPDVDCADVNGPVRVTGPDPHGLDADGDGWGCE